MTQAMWPRSLLPYLVCVLAASMRVDGVSASETFQFPELKASCEGRGPSKAEVGTS